MALIDRLHEIVDPLCLDLGVDLYDLDVNGGVVRVTIDKPGGVDLGEIAQLTREVSRAFDAHDPINGRYTLEVSSPGLERPLRTPAHYVRSVGDEVKIKTRPGLSAERRVEGVLVSADDHEIVVRTGAGAERRIAIADIEKARTVFAWGPTPKPGGPKAAKPAKAAKAPAAKAAKAPADSPKPDSSESPGAPAASTEPSAPSGAVKVVNA